MTTIVRPTRYECAAGAGPATLIYDDASPFEVRLAFIDKDGPAPWAVARDLLVTALTISAGIGDIHCCSDLEWFYVTVSNRDDAPLTLRIRIGVMRTFLAGTAVLVPYGDEQVDFDAALSKLLIGEW